VQAGFCVFAYEMRPAWETGGNVAYGSQAERLTVSISSPLCPQKPTSRVDPQVTAVVRLTTWAGLRLEAVDVVNIRLALMAMLPNIAGLVLCFGIALAFRRADD
jgi:hypothetical protein